MEIITANKGGQKLCFGTSLKWLFVQFLTESADYEISQWKKLEIWREIKFSGLQYSFILAYSHPPDGFGRRCKFVNMRFVGLWQEVI
jgi:hypothetical protein